MRNRRYETVFILPSDSDEGKKRDILDRLDGVVEKGGGIRETAAGKRTKLQNPG